VEKAPDKRRPKSRWHSVSLFPEQFDRVAFVLYFLGGTVPLVALGVVVERYQLTSIADRHTAAQLSGVVVGIVMLSLGCFAMLRRVVNESLGELEGNNRRLASLLDASRAFSSAQHEPDASYALAASAIALTQAHASCVFLRPRGNDSLKMTASAGARGPELYEALVEPLVGLVDSVMEERHPATYFPGHASRHSETPTIHGAVVVPLPGERLPLGALSVVHTQPGSDFSSSDVDALSTLAGLASVAMVNAELLFAQRNFFSHITDILVTAIDLHLGYNGGHGRRVADLANRLGHRLQLDERQRWRLHFAALLHDIGMLKVDRRNPSDAKAFEKHPAYGFSMLRGIRLWKDVAPLVLHHHERFDGKGYPAGLAGSQIPMEARIIALCEAFDTMTSLTSYKAPVPVDAAVREIEAGSGTQFDPCTVQAFREILTEGVVDAA